MKHIYAYTPSTGHKGFYVPYLNLSKDVDGQYALTVRSEGDNPQTGQIKLDGLKLYELALAILGSTINASED